MKIPTLRPLLLPLAALVVTAGCGDSTSGPDPKVEAKRLSDAQALRGYYDKAQGRYDSLSSADKDAFTKLAGGADKAQNDWEQMGRGSGGAAAKGSSTVSHDGPQANGR